jgi:lipopolysaccharide transport system permease protein
VATATVVVAFVDFLISFVYSDPADGMVPFLAGLAYVVLPAFILLAFFASVGPALWVTALNVK